MASVNKVIVLGNLGRDPEVRYSPSGVAVCNLSVATTRKWKDKSSGEMQEETEWHRVSLFDRNAENAGEYLRKGSGVYIEGRLKTRKFQDKDGVDKYVTEIMGDVMQFVGGRDQDGGGEQRQQRQQQPQRSAPPQGQQRQQPQRQQQPKTNTGFDDMDDDIPF